MRFAEDLRFAFRSLLKSPGFLILSVITLGLGISANTAIFSLFYQVLLRSLPVRHPEQLAVLHGESFQTNGRTSSDNYETVLSYPMYRAVRDRMHSFDGVAARCSGSVQVERNGQSERSQAEMVSGNFFNVLGVRPKLGRLLLSSDDRYGAGNPVAVLSYDYWNIHFGGDASVLNRPLSLNGILFTVVGVAPEGFRGVLSGSSPELYVPLAMRGILEPAWKDFDRPDWQFLTVISRRRSGVSLERAKAELQPVVAAALQAELPALHISNPQRQKQAVAQRLDLRPAGQGLNQLERQWRKPLTVLVSMVSLLLLIASANLANLLLARGVNRTRDTSIRLALGASRGRIASLMLAESIIVAAGGALLGLLLAPVLTSGVLRLLPTDETGGWLSGGVSFPVLAFCTALMAAAALLSGIAPAWQSSRIGESSVLGDRSAAGASGHLSPRLRQVLIAGQLALSFILLSTAGLFGRSLINLMRHSPGFQADSLLTFAVDAGPRGYSPTRGFALYRDIQLRLQSQPGVESVSMCEHTPFSGSESSSNVVVEGYTPPREEDAESERNAIDRNYFRTLGAPLIAGREFDERDTAASSKVAIVNQTFAAHFSPNRSPVGMHMSIGAGGPLDIQIVGVVPDMQNLTLRQKMGPVMFRPYTQEMADRPRVGQATFCVRARSTDALAASVRSVVTHFDSGLPVYNIETMRAKINNSVYTDRLLTALTTAFGMLALILTAVGLYGVIAYVVGRRTAEIGIRMALGATGGNVIRMVLREVSLLIAFGLIAGAAGALAASRAIESQLFGMEGFDPWVLAAAAVVLTLVGLSAGAIPAFRAARIHPLTALRHT